MGDGTIKPSGQADWHRAHDELRNEAAKLALGELGRKLPEGATAHPTTDGGIDCVSLADDASALQTLHLFPDGRIGRSTHCFSGIFRNEGCRDSSGYILRTQHASPEAVQAARQLLLRRGAKLMTPAHEQYYPLRRAVEQRAPERVADRTWFGLELATTATPPSDKTGHTPK